ncbi:MAG: HlyC/CorC family transporter [Candidatus Sericytochromatia bacterium]|nr:HlyC/CorC family transporter [Candidatus Tanganyikabacteria bacterium]
MDPERSFAVLALAAFALLLAANAALLAAQIAALRSGRPLPWLTRFVRRPKAGDRPARAVTTALTTIELPDEDQRILHKALAFQAKVVSEVMVPRLDMISVPADAPIREVLQKAAGSSHSRLPVYDGDLDHIVGFVHAKDLLRLAADATRPLVAREIMRPILAVPENKSVDDMLREFQVAKTHVAIVIDEFGGTSGMVTINDLLEELVGEIFDEVRQGQPDYESLADGSIRVSGRMAIGDVNERFGLSLPDDEFNTIAGLVFGCLGRTPSPGDVADIDGIRVRVEATNGRRATQLVLHPPRPAPAP